MLLFRQHWRLFIFQLCLSGQESEFFNKVSATNVFYELGRGEKWRYLIWEDTASLSHLGPVALHLLSWANLIKWESWFKSFFSFRGVLRVKLGEVTRWSATSCVTGLLSSGWFLCFSRLTHLVLFLLVIHPLALPVWHPLNVLCVTELPGCLLVCIWYVLRRQSQVTVGRQWLKLSWERGARGQTEGTGVWTWHPQLACDIIPAGAGSEGVGRVGYSRWLSGTLGPPAG